MNNYFSDNFIKHWIIWSLITIVISLQLLIGIIYVFSFFPVVLHDPVTHQLIVPPQGLELEREQFFYVVFLIIVGLLYLTGFLFSKIIETDSWLKQAGTFLLIEMGWLGLFLFGIFKLLTYQYPFYNFLPNHNYNSFYGWLIVASLGAVLSKIFWPEIWRQMQRFNDPQVRISKRISVGVVILSVIFMVVCLYRADAMQVYGGLMMRTVVGVLLFACLIVQITQNIWLAMAGGCWLIKMSLFNYAQIESPWINSPIHLGNSLAELVALNIMWYLIKRRDWRLILVGLIFMVGVMIKIVYFIPSLDPLPHYFSLKVRQFSSYVMFFLIPMGYLFILMISLQYILINRIWSNRAIFLVVSAIYGLISYSVVIISPMIGGYSKIILPWLLIVFVVLGLILNKLTLGVRRLFIGIILVISLISLTTNRLFVIYHQGDAVVQQP